MKNNTTRLRNIIPDANTKVIGMQLLRTAWVRLNCLQTGAGRFCSNTEKWGVASSATCEYRLEEQTTNHVASRCPLYCAPIGARGLQHQTTKPLASYLKHAQTSSLVLLPQLCGGKRITPRL